LNQENIVTPDAFQEDRLVFAVTEFLNVDSTQGAAKALGNFFG
jgi:hypothetical protein